MNLNKIGMILADTSRSKCYLKALIKNKLIPNYVLILLNLSNTIIAGQKKITSKREIINLLKSANINYETTINDNINNNDVVKLIKNRSEKVFIFSGYGGALLKEKILNIGKKFLHVHGGYLPDYKGSTTNYYSLINENKMGASAIFLTKDIDSGSILLRKKFPSPQNRKKIDHVYDSEVRAKVLIACLKKYILLGNWEYEKKKNLSGEIFYIIHPVLKHLAILSKNKFK
jgi:methionyl-tRNA formyltransferase